MSEKICTCVITTSRPFPKHETHLDTLYNLATNSWKSPAIKASCLWAESISLLMARANRAFLLLGFCFFFPRGLRISWAGHIITMSVDCMKLLRISHPLSSYIWVIWIQWQQLFPQQQMANNLSFPFRCGHGRGTKYGTLCLWQIVHKKCSSYSGEDIILLRLRVIQDMSKRQWCLAQTTLIRGIPKKGKISVSCGNIKWWECSLACCLQQQC